MKVWYNIKAPAGLPAEISVVGPIGNTWDGEGLTARQFIADLIALKAQGVTDASLMVNSPGGSLFDGLAIYTAIASSGMNVVGKVMGVAASAASIILMACSKIIMPANTHMMIHRSGGQAMGNADVMRATADVMDGLDRSIAATYAARTGMSQEDVLTLLDAGDVWMSAEEAVASGFADEVGALVVATAQFDIEKLPEAARAAFTAALPPPAAQPDRLETIQAEAQRLGLGDFVASFAADPRIGNAEQARAVLAEAAELIAVATMVGDPSDLALAAGLIRNRSPLAISLQALADAQTARYDATHVSTVPPARKSPAVGAETLDPNALWDQIRPIMAGSTKK